MKVVVQRVRSSRLTVDDKEISRIGEGLLILIGIASDDGDKDIDYIVRKCVRLRIFDDADGVMNRSVLDIGGEVMLVSQFTLMASTQKGNRPSYIHAAPGEISEPLYEKAVQAFEQALEKPVARGVFGADMQIALTNNGPVTIIIDSKNA